MGGLCYAAAYGRILPLLHYWKTPAICPASPITWTGLSSAVKPVENRLLLWLWALAAMLQALQAAVSLILPRERLIAILTNNFMPCNGRLPLFITLILLFLCSSQQNAASYAVSALILTLFILLGIAMTFLSSYLLSATVLSGVSSSFTLEMPPLQTSPDRKVILRSVTDRTLFVLGRAAAVAAPAGLILWLLANVSPGGISLLSLISLILDPWPPAGYGRRYPYSFYPWTSRQRDRPSHYPYGLYSPRESDGIRFHTPAKADPYSKRLDLDHRSVRHALLPDALAMLHHPYYYL